MSKWVAGLLIFLFLLLGLFSIFMGKRIKELTVKPESSTTAVRSSPTGSSDQTTSNNLPFVAQVATNLDTPWAMAFLPNKDILFTERAGRVRLIEAKGELNGEPVAILKQEPIATISEVKEIGEGGLLGIAVHPEFEKNHFVYLYYTYSGDSNNTRNRVVRYKFENNTLTNTKNIVDAIPGASNHDGGRIKFGPDGYLYVATGDSQEPSLAQNKTSLAGKILRVTDPSAGSGQVKAEVYSYGHRNPQGLTWDDDGRLWATEHGRSGIQSGLDELNFIEQGKNYGWPEIEGDEKGSGMVTPALNSGASDTWAPSGAAYYKGSIFFTGLRGQGLYEAVLSGPNVVELKKHFDHEYGRIRDVIVGPDDFLYISTSNKDGRGNPQENDDKIMRVNPSAL